MKYFYRCALALLLLAAPAVGSAFAPDVTQVIPLTDEATLFQIDFTLGYQKFAMTVPIWSRTAPAAGEFSSQYEVQQAGLPFAGATKQASIMLSDAVVQDGSYYVPLGSAARFSFIVLVQHEPGMVPDLLQVTEVPFLLTDRAGTVRQNGLTNGELSRFVAGSRP